MTVEARLVKVLQALSCLALALALVLSPPSAAHAHEASHSGSAMAVSVAHMDHAAMGHGERAGPQGGDLLAGTDGGDDEGPQQCCNGICLTIALSDGLLPDLKSGPDGHEAILPPRLIAYDPIGFLRPPKYQS
ncbi:hypothetical protein [Puniceibacterium confluentis]|uniref:hypothetical protein n=1 Tax=Puniceibacterium confluentis TaxID=1958944 RepID=UPI00164867E6|nr:hypothetical protein [Puniceibacterium confluentis]